MLTANVMFVNLTAILIASPIKIRFVIVKHVPIWAADNFSRSPNKTIKLYGRGGFVISVIIIYMEFKKVIVMLDNAEVYITAAQEHVG